MKFCLKAAVTLTATPPPATTLDQTGGKKSLHKIHTITRTRQLSFALIQHFALFTLQLSTWKNNVSNNNYRNLKTTGIFSLSVSFRSTIPIIDNQFVFLPSLQKTGHGGLVVDWPHRKWLLLLHPGC